MIQGARQRRPGSGPARWGVADGKRHGAGSMHGVSESVRCSRDGGRAPVRVRPGLPSSPPQQARAASAARRARRASSGRARAAAEAPGRGAAVGWSRAGFGRQLLAGIGEVAANRGRRVAPVTSYLPARCPADSAEKQGLRERRRGRSGRVSRASFGARTGRDGSRWAAGVDGVTDRDGL